MNLPSNYHVPAEDAADEICNLFDQLSFTAEYPIDPVELKKMIAEIIVQKLEPLPQTEEQQVDEKLPTLQY